MALDIILHLNYYIIYTNAYTLIPLNYIFIKNNKALTFTKLYNNKTKSKALN